MRRNNIASFSELEKEENDKKIIPEVKGRGRKLGDSREKIKAEGEKEKYCCPRCGRSDCPSVSN